MRTISNPTESAIAPTEEDVRQALSDGDRIEETDGGAGTPVIGEEAPIYSPILGLAAWLRLRGHTGCRQSRPKTPSYARNRPSLYR